MKTLVTCIVAISITSCGVSAMKAVSDEQQTAEIQSEDARGKKSEVQTVANESVIEVAQATETSINSIELEEITNESNVDLEGSNQIINGDFSYPTLNSGWELFSSAEEDMDAFGWNVSFNSSQPCSIDDENNGQGLLEIQRHGSKQFAELDSHCRVGGSLDTSITIQQTVVLAPGTYVLHFRYKDRKGGNDGSEGLSVKFGETKIPVVATGKWQSYTAKVTVSGDSQAVEVVFKDEGKGDTYGALLDDVLVAPYQPTEAIVGL